MMCVTCADRGEHQRAEEEQLQYDQDSAPLQAEVAEYGVGGEDGGGDVPQAAQPPRGLREGSQRGVRGGIQGSNVGGQG